MYNIKEVHIRQFVTILSLNKTTGEYWRQPVFFMYARISSVAGGILFCIAVNFEPVKFFGRNK